LYGKNKIEIVGKYGAFHLSMPDDISESDILMIHNIITPLLDGKNVSEIVGSFSPGDVTPTTCLKYKITFCFSSPRSFEKLRAVSALRKAFSEISLKESKDIVDGIKELPPIYAEELYHLNSIFNDKGVTSYKAELVVVEI